jgi:hypothetical protein
MGGKWELGQECRIGEVEQIVWRGLWGQEGSQEALAGTGGAASTATQAQWRAGRSPREDLANRTKLELRAAQCPAQGDKVGAWHQ